MASTYLTLVNNVLRDFNEVELTSSNFATSRGVQTAVKDYVNRSITDILNSELNWPFTRAAGSVDVIAGKALYSHASIASTLKYVDYDTMFLKPKDYITNGDFEIDGAASITNWTAVSGTPVASSKFGNTLLLTNAEASQEVTDLIVGRSYIVLTQTSGATLTLEIGTSSGGSQTKSVTLTIASGNEVALTETTFTATATTHYVSFTEASGNAAYVKLVELSEDVVPIPLKYLSYEEYNDEFRERDNRPDTDKFADPEYVYTTYNDEIGLTPIPDTSNKTLEFDYYVSHTDLSASTDTSIIPTRFEPVIIARAKYYTHLFRSDVQSAQFSLKEYEDGIKRMRIELLNRKNYMRAV
mgnify:FL=1|tara:strand:- start:1575 stop:2639 length:1065 start_codon:yes stop_codon:yes gene_type:complete